MLVMFRAKNYNSFKDDVILDLRKTSVRQHKEHVFECGKFELLKTIAIYGANASGKSNLISAMSSFERFMQGQLFNDKFEETFKNEVEFKRAKMSLQPFLLCENINKEIEFEIVFIHEEKTFQYGYSIEESIIKTEWLYINDELVFERENNDLKFGVSYKAILEKYSRIREDRLYISILDYFAVEDELKSIIDDFKDYFNKKFNVYFEIIFEATVKGNISMVGVHENLTQDECFREKVSKYVRKIDVGIKEIVIDQKKSINKETGEEREEPILKTVHEVYDSLGKVVGEKTFDLRDESSGTLYFLSFIQSVLSIMDSGGVFIVDEMSSRLHPLLTKFIVDMFQSEVNRKNAQLIFTTHDVTLMNRDQFRRDELVLIDKNERGESSLYTLADIDVRQDATFNKDYFKGKYGAIPIINDFLYKECGE